MIVVYLSSPYTKGDQALNVRKQMEVTDKLMDKGFCTITPLYTHFQHMFMPRDYEDWMKIDLELIRRCDVVLRLPGESSGADREVAYAEELGIPVKHAIWELEKLELKQRI